MRVGTRLISLKLTVIPTVVIPVWWLEIGWFRVGILHKATKHGWISPRGHVIKYVLSQKLQKCLLLTVIFDHIFYAEFSGLQKRSHEFLSSVQAIPPKWRLKKTRNLIDLLNLNKSIEFLKITRNIWNMLRTFSIENCILNRKGCVRL